jgi:hypothetical protein
MTSVDIQHSFAMYSTTIYSTIHHYAILSSHNVNIIGCVKSYLFEVANSSIDSNTCFSTLR